MRDRRITHATVRRMEGGGRRDLELAGNNKQGEKGLAGDMNTNWLDFIICLFLYHGRTPTISLPMFKLPRQAVLRTV